MSKALTNIDMGENEVLKFYDVIEMAQWTQERFDEYAGLYESGFNFQGDKMVARKGFHNGQFWRRFYDHKRREIGFIDEDRNWKKTIYLRILNVHTEMYIPARISIVGTGDKISQCWKDYKKITLKEVKKLVKIKGDNHG